MRATFLVDDALNLLKNKKMVLNTDIGEMSLCVCVVLPLVSYQGYWFVHRVAR